MSILGRREIFWGASAFLVALFVLALVFLWDRPTKRPQTPPSAVTNISFDQLPDRFPQDVPLFGQTAVTENFTVDGSSTFETTRAFLSALTAEDALADYQKFFLADGWQLASIGTTAQSVTTIIGHKDTVQLELTVGRGPYAPTSTSRITLQFTYAQ